MASCTEGEGWIAGLEACRGNPGVQRRESEGSGIAGGMSWVAGDWSTGAGQDLRMSREENTEGERGKEKQRINQSPTSEHHHLGTLVTQLSFLAFPHFDSFPCE